MELLNGKYELSGGVDPLKLGEEFGYPLYVYDSAVIKRQYDRMVKAFDVKNLKINYACKALTNLSVVKLMNKLGAGLRYRFDSGGSIRTSGRVCSTAYYVHPELCGFGRNRKCSKIGCSN